MSYKIAIVGATGKVGREIIEILHERKFPVKELVPIASPGSKGKEISFGEKSILKAQSLTEYNFNGTDISIFAAGREVSKNYVKKAAEHSIVIDNSSYFRMEKDIPLIIPEVNIEDLKNFRKNNIIANPNCALTQLLIAIKPLDDVYETKRIVLSTYQSTSGAGKLAMDELFNQTKSKYMNGTLEAKEFQKQIAFNVIPQIGTFRDDGYTEEEWKIMNEAKKIMGTDLDISATCVRVPVFLGHSLSVNIEFYQNIKLTDAKSLLKKSKAIEVVDKLEDGGYITPIETAKEDSVFVSRMRQDGENRLNLWVVADNLRKGAALNSVQIAEEIIKKYM